MKTNLQVHEGGRVKPATVKKPDYGEAYGRWSRALKPIGLGTLAWETGTSQNTLAHEFCEIVHQEAYRAGYAAGRASLWRAA